MDRVVYLISDLHLGPGYHAVLGDLDPLEDFNADAAFVRFVKHIGASRMPVELVIAGDFLEYTQTLPAYGFSSDDDRLSTTEAESLDRTLVMMGRATRMGYGGHPEVFAALREFMSDGHSVTLLVGNHDIDLRWRRVWAVLFDAIYPPGAWGDLRLVHYDYTVGTGDQGRVYIVHGNEFDKANAFGDRMQTLFGIDRNEVLRLRRCWGTLFVDKVYNELEYERWFIDNIKPIPRVLKLGLRYDPLFTGRAFALITRLLFTSLVGPTFGDILGASDAPGSGAERRERDGQPSTASEGADVPLGATPAAQPSAEEVVNAIQDEELRAILRERLADPAFKAEFEHELGGMTWAEWEQTRQGAPQSRLDEVGAAPAGPAAPPMAERGAGEVLGEAGEVLGGAALFEDDYRSAARQILSDDPRIATVIMGHTHVPIHGDDVPLELGDGRTGRYFNSGTWTRHLNEEHRRDYTWAEMQDPANYTVTLTYLTLTPDAAGRYRVTMQDWVRE